ncbi:response regulator [soil metagenome]
MNTSPVVDILLVEDDPYDLEMTLRGLSKAHIVDNIHVARDGAEALDFIFCEGVHSGRRIEDHPKLILLDLKLPKVNGLEVLTRVKADPRTRAIPVVMLTSSHQASDLRHSYRIGVNSYIVKPVEFESFVRAVGQLGLYWLLHNEVAQPG